MVLVRVRVLLVSHLRVWPLRVSVVAAHVLVRVGVAVAKRQLASDCLLRVLLMRLRLVLLRVRVRVLLLGGGGGQKRVVLRS